MRIFVRKKRDDCAGYEIIMLIDNTSKDITRVKEKFLT